MQRSLELVFSNFKRDEAVGFNHLTTLNRIELMKQIKKMQSLSVSVLN